MNPIDGEARSFGYSPSGYGGVSGGMACLNHRDEIICVYGLNKHSGSVVMDILRTHPMVIVGGVLQENLLYVPPDEFLAELRQRRLSDEPRAT